MGMLKFCRIGLLILDRLSLIGCLRELQGLAKEEEIAFNADFHSELVRLSYKDFERLVRPTAAKFSLRPQVIGIPETPVALTARDGCVSAPHKPHRLNRTNNFPKFCPRNNPWNAPTAFSTPSTSSSRCFALHSRNHA